MNRYLSLMFLYNRAGYKKVLIAAAAIPLSFAALFLIRTKNPGESGYYMMLEHAFGGVWAALLFVIIILAGLMSLVNSFNGKKAMKAAHSTTGYTIRRLRMSPISSYITMFIYYLIIILIFWGVAIASLYIIGRTGLAMAGAFDIDTKLALGLLRTQIGKTLIPIANPSLIAFNAVCVLALAGECARSCYLSWHNGRPSFVIVVIFAVMFLVWTGMLNEIYILMAIIIILGYAAVASGDVIAREKHPKGDPFKANQYAGVMDLDGFEFDDSVYAPQVNNPVVTHAAAAYDPAAEDSALHRYGRAGGKKEQSKFNLGRIRRRFLPLGINLERANTLLGGCIFAGIAEHLLFCFRYITQLEEIKNSLKGISIAAEAKMPYFWELQEHTYYGYVFAMVVVFFLQAYWNWEYYNKKTKSVYVMKRLPDRKEYYRTIWTAPAIEALLIAVIMVLHTLTDLIIYVLGTPRIALHADYLSHILPF